VPKTVTRTCTIPPGKALFFPLWNAWADNTGCPYTTFTVAELTKFAEELMDNPAIACTIDGVPVRGIDISAVESPYRVGAQVFSYTLAPTDNILANYYGLSCIADGTTVYPAVEDGVYLMLAPLSAGRHTIHFTVEGLDITYDLTVK
jgi:hypothetical protein